MRHSRLTSGSIHSVAGRVAEQIFSPVPEDVARTRAMMKAYEEALAQGPGAVQYEEKMIASSRFAS